MAKSKTNSRPSLSQVAREGLASLLQPGVAMPLAVVVIAVIGLYVGWRTLGPAILGDRRHLITAELVEVTPQPEWIRANVKAEVLESNGLLGKSALDPQVTVNMARAFGVHSWVAQVKRVRKAYPARLFVELDYRRPVGMVMVRRDDGGSGVIPVDERGVVLPTEDFIDDDQGGTRIKDYLRISVGDTRHHGPTGTLWGDDRVSAAAKLATFLSDSYRECGIQRIELSEESTGRRAEDLLFELVDRHDRRYVWGHLPGNESSQELRATEKLELLQLLVANGSTEPARYDLRSGSRQPSVHVPSGQSPAVSAPRFESLDPDGGRATAPHSARSGPRANDGAR